jgi:hypothetical protein
MTNNRHDIAMSARLGPQNAKAILDIMVCDALDETGWKLLRLILGRVFHCRRGRITSCTHAVLLKPVTGRQHWSRDLAPRSIFSNATRTARSAYCRTSQGLRHMPLPDARSCGHILDRVRDHTVCYVTPSSARFFLIDKPQSSRSLDP